MWREMARIPQGTDGRLNFMVHRMARAYTIGVEMKKLNLGKFLSGQY